MKSKKLCFSFLPRLLYTIMLLNTCYLAIYSQIVPNSSVFNVLDFGAVGDGNTIDTKAIQEAIDAAAKAGNGARVFIPAQHRYLVGTISLKSNIDFHLDGDAELYASTDQSQYINDAVITAYDVHNLKISGTGSFYGRDLKFMKYFDKESEIYIPADWRPKMFVLTKCTKLDISDITIAACPNWGLHMLGCEQVLIDNIHIKNNLEVPNCDGIDPDHCRNVVIKNCDIACGDDGIVIKATRQTEDFGPSENIRVYNCIIETQDAGLKIGTETTSDIRNVVFERCTIKTSSRGICVQLRDEGTVSDITFKDIKFISRYYSDPWWGRGEGISFTAIPRTPQTKLGMVRNIKVINVHGVSENSIRIHGTKEGHISDILLQNICFTLDKTTRYQGGLYDSRPTTVYAPIENNQSNAGISLRYVDNIRIDKCTIHWGNHRPDYYTYAIEGKNVTGFILKKFKGKSAHPDNYKAILVE
jgi:polygalacturonase